MVRRRIVIGEWGTTLIFFKQYRGLKRYDHPVRQENEFYQLGKNGNLL